MTSDDANKMKNLQDLKSLEERRKKKIKLRTKYTTF